MVEIDYYSKYLKYKQKYLKQKNLQIGGETIFLNIKLINNNTLYQYQILNLDETIEEVIIDWFVNKNIIPKGELTVKDKDNRIFDIKQTFRVYKEKNTLNDNSLIFVEY